MYSISKLKKKGVSDLLLAMFTLLMLVSACKKEDTAGLSVNTNNNLTTLEPGALYSGTYISSTIYGQIVDESGAGLENAAVSAFGQATTTDKHGFFYLNAVSVDSKRAYVRVEKSGYFAGSRAFIPIANGKTKIKVMLMDNTAAYSVDAASGGKVELSTGPSLEFPANAVVDENGNTYAGTIKVAAVYLNPEDENLGLLMPADMAALDEDEQEVMLRTFGMLNVELTGNSGQKLQVASGKQVKMNMPVPSSLLADAPSTIALWYFDEEYGAWKEDGEATLSNGIYSGYVSHFTTWNCDWQGPKATVSGRVVDCNGNALVGVPVSLGGGNLVYTDSAGYYTSWVAADPGIIIVVSVNEPTYGLTGSLTIGSLTSGQQVVAQTLQVSCPAYVTGSLIDCNNQAVVGYVYMESGSLSNLVQTDANGNFSLIAPSNVSATIYGIDLNNGSSQGLVVTTPSMGGTVSAGTLSVCGINLTNSFYITGGSYNNQLIVLNTTAGYADGYSYSTNTYIGISDNVDGEYLSFNFNGNTIGSYALDPWQFNIAVAGVNADSSAANTIVVDVTKYDVTAGGTIEGTFSGSFQDWNNVTYTITNGQFAVTRKN